MKYSVHDKVRTVNMDGKYNNALGTVIEVFTDMDIETVYMVEYDTPFGSCTKGMYKESDLKNDDNTDTAKTCHKEKCSNCTRKNKAQYCMSCLTYFEPKYPFKPLFDKYEHNNNDEIESENKIVVIKTNEDEILFVLEVTNWDENFEEALKPAKDKYYASENGDLLEDYILEAIENAGYNYEFTGFEVATINM